MPHPDLEVSGWGGGGGGGGGTKGGGAVSKTIFLSKNKGGAGPQAPPLDPPLNCLSSSTVISKFQLRVFCEPLSGGASLRSCEYKPLLNNRFNPRFSLS